jgi:hypothetical protein
MKVKVQNSLMPRWEKYVFGFLVVVLVALLLLAALLVWTSLTISPV